MWGRFDLADNNFLADISNTCNFCDSGNICHLTIMLINHCFGIINIFKDFIYSNEWNRKILNFIDDYLMLKRFLNEIFGIQLMLSFLCEFVNITAVLFLTVIINFGVLIKLAKSYHVFRIFHILGQNKCYFDIDFKISHTTNLNFFYILKDGSTAVYI